MFTFQTITKIIGQAYTGKGLKFSLRSLGLAVPAKVTAMYLAGESAEYIAAASLAIMQVGE